MYRIYIVEDGIGIAPEELPRVFENGFTGFNGRVDRRASGIGLYLCRRVCVSLGHEIAITSAVGEGTSVCGLFAGIVVSKLAELGLMNVVRERVTFDFRLSAPAIGETALLFCGIFAVLYLISLAQIRLADPVTLLRSENAGEKPPKANWFLGAAGVVLLAAAYRLAVSLRDPLSTLTWFFVAVIFVILATYLLMISGSVVLCRILQKRKGYYYRKEHFVSVSSMRYRMKRNGAGLASICILVTMVLVMISSTSCLYFGADDALSSRYPYDMNCTLELPSLADCTEQRVQTLRRTVQAVCNGVQPEEETELRMAKLLVSLEGDTARYAPQALSEFNLESYQKLRYLCFLPLADYNRATGETRTLQAGQALCYGVRCSYAQERLNVEGVSLQIVGEAKKIPVGSTAADVIHTLFLVVSDLETIAPLGAREDGGDLALRVTWNYAFSADLDEDAQRALYERLGEVCRDLSMEGTIVSSSVENRIVERSDFYGAFGGLFFLGIVLSIVFLVDTVLIVYYKQLCEGYEDQARFDIMQKVGMTRRDIRRSVNSQMLTVFFLPLGLAIAHLAFAFPMIYRLLNLFNVTNLRFLLLTTAISVLIFAAFYALVYRMTYHAYCSIVGGTHQDTPRRK